MENIYYDPRSAGSFGGVKQLARYSGETVKSVEKWLPSQDAYTLHKPVRKIFPRRKTFAKKINDLFQADIADMQNLSRYNNGYRFILTCIDVFSKYAFAIPLKDKRGITVVGAFEKIFTERVPLLLQTDRGTEFYNSHVQNLFNKYNIHHYSTYSEYKAAVVERFNLTLKQRIFRYLTYKRTSRWIDVLDGLTHSYNHSYHRTIGMAPIDVTPENEKAVAQRMFPPKPKLVWKFKAGDNVRITKSRSVFDKSYLPSWSEEIFVVDKLHPTFPVTYGLIDLMNEPIKGKFYEPELQLIDKSDSDVYIVDRVIRTRRRNGELEYFVKCRGYPDKFNSWTTNVHTYNP